MEDDFRKKGQGRRSNFEVNQKVIDEVKAMSQRGMNQTHIRNYYGVSKSAWQRKMIKYPELKNSYAMGKSKGISFAAGKLFELIKSGNLEAIKFYLSRIGKWTENPETEDGDSEVKKQTSLVYATNDPIEAAKIYQQFMKGSKKDE